MPLRDVEFAFGEGCVNSFAVIGARHIVKAIFPAGERAGEQAHCIVTFIEREDEYTWSKPTVR